jgi:hypothetical protein
MDAAPLSVAKRIAFDSVHLFVAPFIRYITNDQKLTDVRVPGNSGCTRIEA